MTKFEQMGLDIRNAAKKIVLDFLEANFCTVSNCKGIRLAELFRNCGLDWGDKENATSSNQQYWLVACLRELEKEKKVIRNSDKLWQLV